MKKDLLYSGKAKDVYLTDKEDEVVLFFKDDATAFNGLKKESIVNKGILNTTISTFIYQELEKANVKTHFIKKISDNEQVCKKVQIVPLEFICRNKVYGSMANRLGIPQGKELKEPIFEICYKKDELNDPLINDSHAITLDVCSKEELELLYSILDKINNELIKIFKNLNIELLDFKVEFGVDKNNEFILADEISPDSCRLLDIETKQQLDKDLFRHDLGDLTNAYSEIVSRIEKNV